MNRRWAWFFLFLLVVAPFAIAIPIWYNSKQQLTLDRLEAARERWRDKGPRDYVADYSVRHDYNPEPGGRAPERYTVRVRNGQAIEITGPDGKPRPRSEVEFATMDELFAHIERQLREDIAAGGRRPFMVAAFGKEDGHVARYRRSVLATRELYEVEAKLKAE